MALAPTLAPTLTLALVLAVAVAAAVDVAVLTVVVGLLAVVLWRKLPSRFSNFDLWPNVLRTKAKQ